MNRKGIPEEVQRLRKHLGPGTQQNLIDRMTLQEQAKAKKNRDLLLRVLGQGKFEVKELAQIWEVSISAIYTLIAGGYLGCWRIGGKIQIPLSEAVAFLERNWTGSRIA